MAGVVLTNLSGYSFGVQNEETGMNVQKITIKASSQHMEVKDRVGRVIGRADWGYKQEYNLEGFVSGSGLTSVVIATIVTVASITSLGGISSGACLLDELNLDTETGALNKVTAKLTRYADIPSGSTQVTL